MRTRLAALMFLEYVVQGLWSVPLAAFLMSSPHEGGLNMPAGHVALIYATMAIGATLTPLLLGLLCDRLFAVQRMLAVLHLVGATLLAAMLWTSVSSQAELRAVFDEISEAEEIDVWNAVTSDAKFTLHDAIWTRNGLQFMAMSDAERSREWDRARLMKRFLGYFGIYYRVPEILNFCDTPWRFQTNECRNEMAELLDTAMPSALQRVCADPAVIAAAERAFPPLFGLMLAYACVYIPTISLSNVVAFRNLPDPARQYGPFRALGTFGWMAAGWFIGFAAPAVSPLCFLFAAIASGLLGVLCSFLPHTPPMGKPKSIGDALGLPALRMLGERPFLVYVLVAVVATALMPFHNIYTNKFLVDLHVDHPAAVQTLAQPTEILGALLIPWVWSRVGTKWMLTLGLLASAGRFFIFAGESAPNVIAFGLPLHGVGFAFFYIAAALYVDREAPSDLRASAQGLVTLLTLGLGGIVGNWFAGQVVEFHTAGGIVDWRPVWLVPALGTLAAAVGLAMFFREGRKASPHPPAPSPIKGEGERIQGVSSSPSPFMGEGAGG